MASERPFRLHCDHLESRFVLTRDGDPTARIFASFDEAYEYAERQTGECTPLLLYNAHGGLMFETSIFPLPQELAHAREHWRELIFEDSAH